MTLRDWLRTNRVTYKAFGERIGADKAQVWRWANDGRTPTLNQAAAIREATAGDVGFTDWLEDVG